MVAASGLLARDRPAVGHAEHRFRMVSLRHGHLGAVRYELRGHSVSATGYRAQVAVGTVPLERFTRRTGTGARVPPLGGGGFLRVFADDDHDRFVFSPQPEMHTARSRHVEHKSARAIYIPVQKRGGRRIGAGHVAVVSFALRVRSLVLVGRRHFFGQADLRSGLFLVDSRVVFQFFLGQMAGQRAVATVETA